MPPLHVVALCSQARPGNLFRVTVRKPLGLVLSEKKTTGAASSRMPCPSAALEPLSEPAPLLVDRSRWPSRQQGKTLICCAGEVFVEEIVQGGNAAKQGLVQAGDIVRQCSATVLKAGGLVPSAGLQGHLLSLVQPTG
jgi:hypothetical protein